MIRSGAKLDLLLTSTYLSGTSQASARVQMTLNCACLNAHLSGPSCDAPLNLAPIIALDSSSVRPHPNSLPVTISMARIALKPCRHSQRRRLAAALASKDMPCKRRMSQHSWILPNFSTIASWEASS